MCSHCHPNLCRATQDWRVRNRLRVIPGHMARVMPGHVARVMPGHVARVMSGKAPSKAHG